MAASKRFRILALAAALVLLAAAPAAAQARARHPRCNLQRVVDCERFIGAVAKASSTARQPVPVPLVLADLRSRR
jgi:hypothetical protein